MLVPSFLQGFPTFGQSRTGKTLVVIQLSGGNDGLNTIVPYQNDWYYKLRPSLGIDKNQVLKISDDLGLNPALQGLRNLYDNGDLCILNSVGYPNPDRSHFRSMDIWHTASDSSEYLSTGWLGRYLDSNCLGCNNVHHALEVDDSLSLALKGKNRKGFAASKPQRLKRTIERPFLQALTQQQHDQEHENVAYLYKTLIDTQSSANYLFEKARVHDSIIDYPKSGLAKDLKQIAELMTADADIKVYYATLGGFDTHAFQERKHGRLLQEYSEAVTAFVKDLKQNNLFKDTLIMTFSEFGRRVEQNGSGGTDHGTANNVFLMGGQLKKAGFYNAAPNLADLDQGDLKYQIDFRNIYASILDNWLDTSAASILGSEFRGLDLVNP